MSYTPKKKIFSIERFPSCHYQTTSATDTISSAYAAGGMTYAQYWGYYYSASQPFRTDYLLSGQFKLIDDIGTSEDVASGVHSVPVGNYRLEVHSRERHLSSDTSRLAKMKLLQFMNQSSTGSYTIGKTITNLIETHEDDGTGNIILDVNSSCYVNVASGTGNFRLVYSTAMNGWPYGNVYYYKATIEKLDDSYTYI